MVDLDVPERTLRARVATRWRRLRLVVITGVVLAAMVAALAWQVDAAHRHAVTSVETRFADRIELAAGYVRSLAGGLPSDPANGAVPAAAVAPATRAQLERFLGITSSIARRELYVVDAGGAVVASTTREPGAVDAVTLPIALRLAATGPDTVRHRGASWFVVSRPVTGPSWELIAAVPSDQLYEPIDSPVDWLLVVVAAVLAVVVLTLLHQSALRRELLDLVARTDVLTGVPNRRHATEALAHSAARSSRFGRPWALAIVDVDRFKSVNDRYGHGAGDRALQHVAEVLRTTVRTSDLVGRWGGEEFVVVMDDTDAASAVAMGDRLASAIRSSPTVDGLRLTVSIGVAAGLAHGGDSAAAGADVQLRGEPGASADELLRRADEALYECKKGGRDQVRVGMPAALEASPR